MTRKSSPGNAKRSKLAHARKHVRERFTKVTIPQELNDPKNRRDWKLDERSDNRGPYIVELNVFHRGGLPGAAAAFRARFAKFASSRPIAGESQEEIFDQTEWQTPILISKAYFRCILTFKELKDLIVFDETDAVDVAREAFKARGILEEPKKERSIYKVWPDYPVTGQIDRSMATIKADAALRSFDAHGHQITWAVIDSGINGNHVHFDDYRTLTSPDVYDLHRCFAPVSEEGKPPGFLRYLDDPYENEPNANGQVPPLTEEERQIRLQEHQKWALKDEAGHGTHVAGIIAGQAPEKLETEIKVYEREDKVNSDGERVSSAMRERKPTHRSQLRGVAPRTQLVSLRVLDKHGEGRSSDVIRALEYVRERLNDNPKYLRIHGVNLSVGYEFDAMMFACGRSPLCSEVDRLVQSGVVVVTAAGNTGYGSLAANARATKAGLSNTINDPGNAELAITVGSTHRDSPHTYGVSYFSSKGPTGDGRLKPDLLAPGERITSCAAGDSLPTEQQQETNIYIDDSGTSMAAPHVSGAIAAFLSIRQEFIGRPLDVKKIFLQTATSLGRERYFEGHGLVDLMRAIQSV